jgi:hypothetical protein
MPDRRKKPKIRALLPRLIGCDVLNLPPTRRPSGLAIPLVTLDKEASEALFVARRVKRGRIA